MARTATGSEPKVKDKRTKTAGSVIRAWGPKGRETYGLLQMFKSNPEMLTKSQINKLWKQGWIDKPSGKKTGGTISRKLGGGYMKPKEASKKTGGTVKRKSGGGVGIGRALRGGGAIRKK